MAITAAQVSAERKSLATQRAKLTVRIANMVCVTNRARASIGYMLGSGARMSLLLLLRADLSWNRIFGDSASLGHTIIAMQRRHLRG